MIIVKQRSTSSLINIAKSKLNVELFQLEALKNLKRIEIAISLTQNCMDIK